MTVIRTKRTTNYTCLPNEAIRDKRLSFKARGLHHLLMSYPNDWEVNIAHLCGESGKDGRTSIRSAINELEEYGYIQKSQERSEFGTFGNFEYIVSDLPSPLSGNLTPEPLSGKPTADSPQSVNLKQLSTDLNKVSKEKNTKTPLTPQGGDSFELDQVQTVGDQPTPTPVNQAKQSGKAKKGKSSAARDQTSEQILALLPEPMQQRFGKFWQGYSAFCDERQARTGPKKKAVVAWKFLVDGDFNGKGLDGFENGVRTFLKQQGDRTAGIPHAARFLFSTANGSGAWEDALEQAASHGRISDLSEQVSDRGNAPPIFQAPVENPEDFTGPPPGWREKYEKQARGIIPEVLASA